MFYMYIGALQMPMMMMVMMRLQWRRLLTDGSHGNDAASGT